MRAREREPGSNVRTLAPLEGGAGFARSINAQADVSAFRCPQAEARRLPAYGARFAR